MNKPEKLVMRKGLKAKIPGNLKNAFYEFKRREQVKVVDLNSYGYAKVTGMGQAGKDPKYFWIAQEDLHTLVVSV